MFWTQVIAHCGYLLIGCDSLIHLVSCVFNFMKVQFIHFLPVSAFCVLFKKSLPTSVSQRYCPCDSSGILLFYFHTEIYDLPSDTIMVLIPLHTFFILLTNFSFTFIT